MSNASFSVGTTFEIGRVPARTLELKSGCGKLLGEIFCLALRAGAELRLADLLHDVFLKAAYQGFSAFSKTIAEVRLCQRLAPKHGDDAGNC